MPEIAAAILVIAPLMLLVVTALLLVKQGTTASEMTEASRQRFIGCGYLLLLVGLLGCLATFGFGIYWLSRVLHII